MPLESTHYLNAAIGDYIFLIIIIVASIIQAISQNRKKTEMAKTISQKAGTDRWQDEEYQQDTDREVTQQETPMGSFFDEIEKVFIPEMPDNEQPRNQNNIPDQEFVNRQADKQVLNSNITEAELQKEFQKDHSAIDKNQLPTEVKPVVRRRTMAAGFDLKKAIIYSEILNRKYS